MPERILCAAIWVDDGERHTHQPVPTGIVLCGHRHHNVLNQLSRVSTMGMRRVHGFLTSQGRFVDRRDAKTLAVAAGQVADARGLLPHDELDSGDLY